MIVKITGANTYVNIPTDSVFQLYIDSANSVRMKTKTDSNDTFNGTTVGVLLFVPDPQSATPAADAQAALERLVADLKYRGE